MEGCLKSDAPTLPRLPSETLPLGSAFSDPLLEFTGLVRKLSPQGPQCTSALPVPTPGRARPSQLHVTWLCSRLARRGRSPRDKGVSRPGIGGVGPGMRVRGRRPWAAKGAIVGGRAGTWARIRFRGRETVRPEEPVAYLPEERQGRRVAFAQKRWLQRAVGGAGGKGGAHPVSQKAAGSALPASG